MARSHWKKHLPKFYRNLKKSGELEKRVENAARFTLDTFNLKKEKLLKKGWRPQEASEVACEVAYDRLIEDPYLLDDTIKKYSIHSPRRQLEIDLNRGYEKVVP